MMVTIHGLPIGIKYADIKQLIKDKCTIQEFILDNLVVDDNKQSKKIRVGLADTIEGSIVMTQLNRLWFQGNQLTVVPFSKQRQAGPLQQQDNRIQPNNNYQNQGSQRYGNSSQNINSRGQGQGSSDNDPGNRHDFRSNSQTERPNFGPPNTLQNRQNQQDFSREDRNPSWSGPNFENKQGYGDEHRSPMLLNQTQARPDKGLRGSHQNVPSRQDHNSRQNQGPRREPYQDYGSRGQEPIAHDPWGSNQVQWSSNQAQEPPAPFQQQIMNEFDLGSPTPIRVRDFGNQERFASNVPQPQRQDVWAPNNSVMPDPRAPIMPQRVVQVTDNPIVRHDANNLHSRMGKPITIAKDKFQGPTQYSFESEPVQPFRGPNAGSSQPVWEKQAPATSQQHINFDRNAPFTGGSVMPHVNRFMDKPNDRFRNSGPEDVRGNFRRSPIGKRYQSPDLNERSYSPSRHRRSSSGDSRSHRSPRRLSPSRMSPGRKGFSPVRKALSPVQRVISPSKRVISPSRKAFEPNRRGISPSRRIFPPGRRVSPPGRRISPSGRRISPPVRRISPSGRRVSPIERRITPTSRRMASPRRMSPHGRKVSPPRNRFSPTRFSPTRKALSPPKRSFSPPRRGISPSRRGVSPIHRGTSPVNRGMVSPRRGISPQRRGISSPGRRISMELRKSPGRYSPSSLYDDDAPVRVPPSRLHKDVRPAYEPPLAQPKFPSNYRPTVNENVSYPKQGQGDSKVSSWQPNPNFAKDDRRPPMEKKPSDQARFDWEPKRSRSRSPMHRDRSPRDRFRRSPSSPRTSRVWETGVSPDAPPPPSWPGAADFTKSEKGKREPVWETPNFVSMKDDRKMTRAEDPIRRNVSQPDRTPHWDMTKQHRPDDSFQDRPDFQNRRDDRRGAPSTFVDNLMLNEDEKRQDFRKQEISKPVSRFDQKERMPDIHRSARADNFHRHSSDKQNEARNDSYHKQRHNEGPISRHDEANPDKSNRKKAVDVISASLFDKYNITPLRARDEIQLQLSKIVLDMSGNKVMSSDDIVIKFYQNYSNKQQEKIVNEVMASLPSHMRPAKRMGEDISEVASKSLRTEPIVNSFVAQNQMPSYNLVPHPQYGLVQQPIVYPPEMTAPQPLQQITAQGLMPQMTQQAQVLQMEAGIGSGFVEGKDSSLYLCKEDFDKISPHQAEALRDFIVSQIFETTVATGWAPTFIFKGLKSLHRYEITPENDDSAKWLTNVDFTPFDLFNVLVYSREELWYERAAIWLPGHSKCRNIEPLKKLQLQNRHLDGVNMDMWKLVKKIVSTKGTRIYVDMPPSSSKALRTHKLTLSYELQRVNVFLKADAVDKDAFDLGVRENSINDPEAIVAAIQNAPMPFVHDELSIVKICFKGSKMVSVGQAKKIKEMVIYQLFKYLQQPSVKLRTDFNKFGFCLPGYFAIQPENSESKKWLLALNVGKLNKHEIVVVGSTSDSTKYLKMQMHGRGNYNSSVILDRLKTANRGKSHLNFFKWKLGEMHTSRANQNFTLDLEVDIESAQTISKNNFKLDFSDRDSVRFSHKYGDIHKAIKKIKAEEVDNHVVANMDIDSTDDEVITLD